MKITYFIAAFFAVTVFATGCGFTPQGDLIRDVVKQGTQKAGDAGLRNAEWFLCEGAPVGAVKRRYGSADAAEAYAKLCERGGVGNIIAPKIRSESRLSFPSGLPEVLRERSGG